MSETSLIGRDIISLKDITIDEILSVFELADKMDSKRKSDLLRGYILATLFFEPSTRTRLSFESAMLRLGGSVLGFADPRVSRVGDPLFMETLEDTIRMVNGYADVVVMRHPLEGACAIAAEYSDIPVINGGDGFGEKSEHPTQALLDLYTIKKEKKCIEGLTILMMGNLRYIRALHSMAYGLAKFKDIKMILVSPKAFRMPRQIIRYLQENSVKLIETESLKNHISQADVLYVESIPHRRLEMLNHYERASLVKAHSKYRITREIVKAAKKDLIILHPLPRADELGYQIFPEVDNTPYAKYYIEATYGVKVRMALLCLILGCGDKV